MSVFVAMSEFSHDDLSFVIAMCPLGRLSGGNSAIGVCLLVMLTVGAVIVSTVYSLCVSMGICVGGLVSGGIVGG